MGCPFQNCSLLALVLSPTLSLYACISIGGSLLSSFRIYFSLGTSSIPDWILVTPRLGSHFQHAGPHIPASSAPPSSSDAAALQEAGGHVCQELPARPSAVPACPWDARINSHYFDATVSAQKEVIHSSVQGSQQQ